MVVARQPPLLVPCVRLEARPVVHRVVHHSGRERVVRSTIRHVRTVPSGIAATGPLHAVCPPSQTSTDPVT